MLKINEIVLYFICALCLCFWNQALSQNINDDDSSQIVIFVSKSMPQFSLLQWMSEAERSGATVVLRGLVNDSLPETKKWIGELVYQLPKSQGGVAIDPPLFQQFVVTQVPTVVVSQHFARCISDQPCAVTDYDKVSGNVSLRAALEKIAKGDGVEVDFVRQKLEILGK